jgi:hypothetical protein
LDEWTAEQLKIMTLGGNGNARAFFKSHGLTDSQMTVSLLFISYYRMWYNIEYLYG